MPSHVTQPPAETGVGLQTQSSSPLWLELPYSGWSDTYATLHVWAQVVGKIRLAQTPWLNHSWHVTLYVSPRGLTTSTIPYGHRTSQLEFDFSKDCRGEPVGSLGHLMVHCFAPRELH